MRLARVLLVGAGAAIAAYGGWLLRPYLEAATWWLLAGPIVHDAVLAPLVALAGLVLARLLPDPAGADRPGDPAGAGGAARWWVGTGLVVSGTLLLIALPLLLRPAPAAPNPGLQDRDYLTELAIWLGAMWAAILAAVAARRRPGAARRRDKAHADRPR